MVSPISHATQTQPTPQPVARPAAPQAKTQSAQTQPTQTDKVTLSAAASLRQELSETSVQTAREASHGDIQAKNLLSREAADKKAGV